MSPYQAKWLQSLGTVSNLNIYSKQLSSAQMLQKTSGKECLAYDFTLLSWVQMDWELVGGHVYAFKLEADKMCKNLTTRWKFSLQNLLSWAGCKSSCSKERIHIIH